MENPIHRQYVKYETEEDRRKGLLTAFLRYSSKPWTGDVCNKTRHLRSNKHIKYINN